MVSLTCSVGVRSVAPQSQGSREAGTRTAGQRLQAPVWASPQQDLVLAALEGGWEGLPVQLLPWRAQARALMGTRLWEEAGAGRASDLQRTADGNNTALV